MRLDRATQTVAGLAIVVGGMWVLHEAWEGSGKHRPFWLRILPG